MSFQTVAEMWQWAEYHAWSERECGRLEEFPGRFVVIRYDHPICRQWARITAASMKEGRRFEVGDCWIAATAVPKGLPLLARDRDSLGRGAGGLRLVTFLEDE